MNVLGYWKDSLGVEIKVGDLVAIETFDEVLILEVESIKNEILFDFRGRIIPRNQILGIKDN